MTSDTVAKALANNVIALRSHLDISQSQLSDNSTISRALLSSIENGDANLTLSVLVRISNALGVKPWDLLKPKQFSGDIPERYSSAGRPR